MKTIRISPLRGGIDAAVRAPPSKAHTLRALFLASLAEGKSVLKNPLLAEDQLVAAEALEKFGAEIELEKNVVKVRGTGGEMLAPKKVFAANSGVSMRFLCSIACLAGEGGEKISLDGSGRMRERPISELVDALAQLGAKARTTNGFPPVEVLGKTLRGGEASIEAGKSSQFVSSLLVALPLAPENSAIKAKGTISSRPYVDVTIECMKDFGVEVLGKQKGKFEVVGRQEYKGRAYEIEGDYSSAAFFFQAAAITGGRVKVNGLRRGSVQGDAEMLEFLERMGCVVERRENEVEVTGPEKLKPLKADLRDFPDIVIPLAVACAFAGGRSSLENLGQLRFKESDRLAALESELNRIGCRARIENDSLAIEGKPEGLHGARIQTYNDHRIAMAFAVAGLKARGMEIENPGCVRKSFPEFFLELEKLGAK